MPDSRAQQLADITERIAFDLSHLIPLQLGEREIASLYEAAGALRALGEQVDTLTEERDEWNRWAVTYLREKEAAEARLAATEKALTEISRAGAKFDAKGTHSQRVVDIARAALAAAGREGDR